MLNKLQDARRYTDKHLLDAILVSVCQAPHFCFRAGESRMYFARWRDRGDRPRWHSAAPESVYEPHQHPSTSCTSYLLLLFLLDKPFPCYTHTNPFPKTRMVNLRLGSIAPDFKAETSAGDIEVSPVLFCLFVDIPLLVCPDRLFNLTLDICSSTSGPVMTGSCFSPTL